MIPAQGRSALLLDEMFSLAIAEELRRRGHDVIAVAAEPQIRAMTDADLLTWSADHARRLVTENVKDFRPLLNAGEASGPGLLCTSSRRFPRSRGAVSVLIKALDGWLTRSDVAERPPEDWLTPAP